MDYRIAGAWLVLSLSWTLQAASGVEPASRSEELIIFGTELRTFIGFYKSDFEYLPPNTVMFTRRDQDHPDKPLLACSYTVPACGAVDAVDECEVTKALSDARLLDRLPAEGDLVHGGDPRHSDGPINFFTTRDGGRWLTGNPCRARSSECSEENQILQRLVDTFAELRREAESAAECTPQAR